MKLRFVHGYNIPGVLLTKLTNANNKETHRVQLLAIEQLCKRQPLNCHTVNQKKKVDEQTSDPPED